MLHYSDGFLIRNEIIGNEKLGRACMKIDFIWLLKTEFEEENIWRKSYKIRYFGKYQRKKYCLPSNSWEKIAEMNQEQG